MANQIKKAVSAIKRNKKFQALSKKDQARVLAAIKRGRIYLSDSTNGTLAVAGLHYTTKHTGKMTGVVSISTSVLDNSICQARRQNKNSICAHCFAAAQMGCYKNMREPFARNLDILSTRLLEPEEIPVILSESGNLRGESFGDACNVIQAANYLRIAAANPWLRAAVWTKNPGFYHAAIQGGYAEKPANLNIVLSSKYVDKCAPVPEKYAYFIDRVFTMYSTEDAAAAQGVRINCGARSCATCRRCYVKSSKIFEVNELLK